MAEQPKAGRWTRQEFLKTAGMAGSLVAGASWSGRARAQGLRSISASHSVSTLVYGQRLVAAQKKLFEEKGVKTPDFVVPGGGAKVVQALAAGQVALIGVVVGEFIGGESGGGLGYLIIQSLGTLNAADMMVALFMLGAIGMALGIKQVEARLLRWRPEYQKR